MTSFSNTRLVRAIVAVATSILTGAGAGAVLARKPLVVPVDRPQARRAA